MTIEMNCKRQEARGEAKGEARGKIEIARNLLAQKIDIKTIANATGLSVEEVTKLKD